MDIVLVIHSLVRYLILLAALVGVVKVLLSLVQKAKSDQLDRTVASAFLGLYDLQVLLGLLLILLGTAVPILHPIIMVVGLLLAHGLQTMVKRAEGTTEMLYRLALYVVPLIVILVGLSALQSQA